MIKNNKKIIKSQYGMTAIFTVLVISAAALIMVKSVTLLSLTSIDIASIDNQKEQVEYLAEGCTEETIRRIQIDNNYLATNFNLSYASGTCDITITQNGNDRTIYITGTMGDYNKNIQVIVTINNDGIIKKRWEMI